MTKDTVTREEFRRLVHQYVDRCFESAEGIVNLEVALAHPTRLTLEWSEQLPAVPVHGGPDATGRIP